MKLYIAGAIANRPLADALEAFDANTKSLRAAGFHVINPTEHPPRCGGSCATNESMSWERIGDNHRRQCYLKYDLIDMLSCDGVAVIEGWTQSEGAKFEVQVAEHLHMPARGTWEWIRIAEMNPVLTR